MSNLYIVGTPIGNLEDMTLRSIRVLKEVDVIACEDTRKSLKLLNHFGIKAKKIISHHDFNEKQSAHGIISLIMNNNKSVALISDAGMPVINDPGYLLIREAINNNVKIEIIPGPSAVTSTLILSNFDTKFTFHGFFKHKTIQRQNQLKKISKGTHIFLASPHRIQEELKDIDLVLPEAKVFLGRELTKMHEMQYRGSAKDILDSLGSNTKGEFTIAIEIAKNKKENKYGK